MEFAMILSGDDAPTPAPRVLALPSKTGTGIYDERAKEIWSIDSESIRAALPARLRRYVQARSFLCPWFTKGSRIDESGQCKGDLPYLEIWNAKGERIATAYFAPIKESV